MILQNDIQKYITRTFKINTLANDIGTQVILFIHLISFLVATDASFILAPFCLECQPVGIKKFVCEILAYVSFCIIVIYV